jgi:hypothetical protein
MQFTTDYLYVDYLDFSFVCLLGPFTALPIKFAQFLLLSIHMKQL